MNALSMKVSEEKPDYLRWRSIDLMGSSLNFGLQVSERAYLEVPKNPLNQPRKSTGKNSEEKKISFFEMEDK